MASPLLDPCPKRYGRLLGRRADDRARRWWAERRCLVQTGAARVVPPRVPHGSRGRRARWDRDSDGRRVQYLK